MDANKARDRLVAAALKYAAAERGGLDGRDEMNEMSRAKDSLDLAARLYVEEIGPRTVEPPERQYGATAVAGADEEE